jgi:hypothetical protein
MRALRQSAPASTQALRRRPFSRASQSQTSLESDRATAQIFRFTGSNTPYESHE